MEGASAETGSPLRYMSELGQNAKYSERADNFRFAPINGHHQARTPCRKSAMCRHKSSSCPSNHRTRPSEQSHRELGAIAKFAVDRDGAAVLLRYDFVADRQPKPRALAGRLQSILFFGGMPMRLSRTLGPRRRRRTRGW